MSKRPDLPRGGEQEPDRDDFGRRLDELLASGGPAIVYQPVVLIGTDRIIGVEALSRFPAGMNPGQWFDFAASVGRGAELETIAARNALAPLDDARRREIGWEVISVNVSPSTLSDPAFTQTLAPHLGRHVVLELTDRSGRADYPTLRARLDRARELGVRIAVNSVECDPVSQLDYLIRLDPDLIKLDPEFTRLLLRSEDRRELARRTLLSCQQHGAFVIAVGVEQPEDLDALTSLGVEAAQGYLFSKPRPLDELVAAR